MDHSIDRESTAKPDSVSSVVYNAAAVKASELVEKDVADLKKYGLENLAAQVAITYKDNNTLEF